MLNSIQILYNNFLTLKICCLVEIFYDKILYVLKTRTPYLEDCACYMLHWLTSSQFSSDHAPDSGEAVYFAMLTTPQHGQNVIAQFFIKRGPVRVMYIII